VARHVTALARDEKALARIDLSVAHDRAHMRHVCR
jgi:hypothetical protein